MEKKKMNLEYNIFEINLLDLQEKEEEKKRVKFLIVKKNFKAFFK